jgi:putative ABC transport system substrate-binding protein
MAPSETDPEPARLLDLLRQSLAELGWREGANLQVELRWAHDEQARARTYARELVELGPDVIVAHSSSVLAPLRDATSTIPIVFVLATDPVGQGYVSSLARPGGNLTGFTYMDVSTGGKLVELVREIASDTTRVLVLLDGDNRSTPPWWHSIEEAAHALGLAPQQALVRTGQDIDAAVRAFAQPGKGSMVIAPQNLFVSNRARIIDAAARERLPAVDGTPPFASEGGLLSYSVDVRDQFLRAASYVDRILKGEKPGDLPIQLPTRFKLTINLKTAKALGLSVPATLLARADDVIE